MGETLRGGYYRGVNGKLHDANGNEIEEISDRTREKQVEEIKAEPKGEPPTGTATDPGPLGPLVPVPTPEPGTSNAEKSRAKPGVRGGKSGSKSSK